MWFSCHVGLPFQTIQSPVWCSYFCKCFTFLSFSDRCLPTNAHCTLTSLKRTCIIFAQALVAWKIAETWTLLLCMSMYYIAISVRPTFSPLLDVLDFIYTMITVANKVVFCEPHVILVLYRYKPLPFIQRIVKLKTSVIYRY